MTSFSRSLLLLLCVTVAAVEAQVPAKKVAAKPASKSPATTVAPPAKSAFDKTTFEAYVRHLFVWGKNINVEIGEPKASTQLNGFQEVLVHASQGPAVQDETFLISKDGRKILRAMVFDVAQNPFKPDLDKLKTEFQPSLGTPGAPVVIVIFTDFQCPFCKEESKMLRQNLLSAYPKEVRLYFHDFPLPTHTWSRTASIAGRCIFRQNPGAFWDYHDWVYEHQAEITPENFQQKLFEYAKGKEIDPIQLSRCLETRDTEAEVERSVKQGEALNIRSTPTMFVNGRRLEGQIPWPQLREIIDYEIDYQKTAKNAGEDCGCEVKLPSALK